jgi:hypothetical protein
VGVILEKICSIDACSGKHKAKGYCARHYKRLKDGVKMDRPWPGEGEVPHGTSGGYSNYKCRCDPCRIAWNKLCNDRKKKKWESWDGKPDVELIHGLEATYQNHGCRCQECKTGMSNRRSLLAKIRRSEWFLLYNEKVTACEICGKESSKLAVDHDHSSGEFRGLLCHGCNTGLGKFRDSPEMLQTAIDYLLRDKPKP